MNNELINYVANMPIDIFTDTSSKEVLTNQGKVYVVSHGYVALFGFVPITTGVNVTIAATVPVGESKAIEAAINWVRWYFNKMLYKPSIRIFSDSLSSLLGINNIINFYKLRLNGTMKIEIPIDMRSAFNMSVSETCLNIINSGLDVSTYYIPGHIDIYNKQKFDKKYKEYINKFLIHNAKLQLARNYQDLDSYEFLYYAGLYNNHIDVVTRNYLFQYYPFIVNDVKQLASRGIFNMFDDNHIFSKEPISWPVNNLRIEQPLQLAQSMMLT